MRSKLRYVPLKIHCRITQGLLYGFYIGDTKNSIRSYRKKLQSCSVEIKYVGRYLFIMIIFLSRNVSGDIIKLVKILQIMPFQKYLSVGISKQNKMVCT